ncbi:MAG: hypothetical protein ACM3Q1_06425 [Bacteroidales bacterium]
MSPHAVRLLAAAAVLACAACASPYRQALESRELQRPDPPLTAADQRALAPYAAAPYFRDRR